MDYASHYCALISKRLKNPITKNDCYCETHHIIPKSEGGDDDPQNLVNLTAREHYIAHLLLAKIYDDLKMWSAVLCMRIGHNERERSKFNSKLYEVARKKCHAFNIGRNFSVETRLKLSIAHMGKPSPNRGKKLSQEHKRKLSLAKKGKPPHNKGKPMSEEQKRKVSMTKKGKPSPNKGKPMSEEQKKKLSEALKGHLVSEETKRKQSEGLKRYWERRRAAK